MDTGIKILVSVFPIVWFIALMFVTFSGRRLVESKTGMKEKTPRGFVCARVVLTIMAVLAYYLFLAALWK